MKRRIYQKPHIKEQKIKLGFFLNSRFIDSIDAFLVPRVFAQSGCATLCSASGTCTSGTCATGCNACG